MLVVGSGASGLAAAVSAERAGARVALVTKGALQSCNSAKAQGGIQAAFGDDDSPEQHAEDVWQSSHETADRRLVEVLTGEAPARDPLARGARRRVHARERRLPAGALRRRRRASACSRSATAPATRSRRRCATPTSLERRDASRTARCVELEPTENGWRATCCGRTATSSDRRRRRRARRRRALLPRGRGARRALDEPSRRDRRGDAARARARRRERATSTRSSTTRTAAPGRRRCRATRSPRRRAPTAPTLLNADGEEFTDPLGPRDAVSQAIFDEVDAGRGRRDARRPPGGAARHDADRRARRRDLAAVHAAPLPFRRDRPAAGADPHLSRPPLPERRPRHRRARRDDARRASTPAARSRAARTGATG